MSSPSKLKVGIVIVSETAHKDASTDKCIPALRQVFDEHGGDQWTVEGSSIVPDDAISIQRAITNWTDGNDALNLVVTSGGTGFAQKDITPEVRKSQSLRSFPNELGSGVVKGD